MPCGWEVEIVLDRNDDLGDGGSGHAVFLGNLGLALRFAIDDREIALRAHRGLAGLRVGEGLQEADCCLIPEGSARPVAVLLRVPFLPELAEDFQRPPVEQGNLSGYLGRQLDAKTRVEEDILGSVVWKFGTATRFRVICGVSEFTFGVVGHYGPGASIA